VDDHRPAHHDRYAGRRIGGVGGEVARHRQRAAAVRRHAHAGADIGADRVMRRCTECHAPTNETADADAVVLAKSLQSCWFLFSGSLWYGAPTLAQRSSYVRPK